MLIKAGTYRFNDVLEFTLDYIPVCGFNFISNNMNYFGIGCEPVSTNQFALAYCNEEADENSSIAYAYGVSDYGYADGWQVEAYQTITIPTDTEVSTEFYAWFTANAAEQKEISGKWKFNENVVAPSFIGLEDDDYNVNADFTVFLPSSVSIFPFDSLMQCNSMHLNTYAVDSGIGLDITYTCCSSAPDLTEYGYTFPRQEWVYAGDANNGNWKQGDFARTIDFGTTPQYVSVEFYNWMTENATQPSASITHNGSTIAELFPGQTATLKCKGMKMEDDVVVEVSEQTGGGECDCFEDVTELPDVVDKSKVYRIRVETVTEAIIVVGGEVTAAGDYTIHLVDELPESDDTGAFFVLKDSGIAYTYYGSWMPASAVVAMLLGVQLEDKGYVTDEELAAGGLADGVYMHKQDAVTYGIPTPKTIVFEKDGGGSWVRNDTQVLAYMIQGDNYSMSWGVPEITVPHGVHSIKDYAFSGFNSLTKVTLPETVEQIGNYAFYYCSELKELNIPHSVEKIHMRAFNGCSQLTVDLPDKDIELYQYAVMSTANWLNDDNWVGGACYIGTHLVGVKNNYMDAVHIKAGTKYIQSWVFDSSITVPEITLPEGVLVINDGAFAGPCLETLVLPESVIRVGRSLLDPYGKTVMTTVTIKAKTPPVTKSLGDEAFLSDYVSALYVPAESVELYKASPVFSNLADKIFPIEE